MFEELGDGKYVTSRVIGMKKVPYQMLDVAEYLLIADFLRQKESNMRQIVGKAYTELGKELYDAQQRLASHNKYEGVFVKWCGYLGFTMKQVYRLIDRYNLLTNCQNSEQKEFLEDLPVSLTYEISGKSSESTPAKAQAKSEVLAGASYSVVLRGAGAGSKGEQFGEFEAKLRLCKFAHSGNDILPDLAKSKLSRDTSIELAKKAGRSVTIFGGMDRALQIWRGR
ncbi:hypothetical protein [Siminovitchia sp. 179-K 8D1 HS]|uniref:hypothetical protein n=1 Tax=Siminovitchia sp. 179-K 8D1 HS TaxID=3142385 RepID=UPI0039A2A566